VSLLIGNRDWVVSLQASVEHWGKRSPFAGLGENLRIQRSEARGVAAAHLFGTSDQTAWSGLSAINCANSPAVSSD